MKLGASNLVCRRILITISKCMIDYPKGDVFGVIVTSDFGN